MGCHWPNLVILSIKINDSNEVINKQESQIHTTYYQLKKKSK